MQAGSETTWSDRILSPVDFLTVFDTLRSCIQAQEKVMEQEQKKTTKGPFIGGCVVGLIIGIIVTCIGVGTISFISFKNRQHMSMIRHTNMPSMSITEVLGRYELADADAVKEFNSRVKKWFAERGFEELEDMPLRSIERIPVRTSGNVWSSQARRTGDWNKPGVLLLKKFDDQNSLYILVPDCYHRENHVQMIGYRSDFVGISDKTRGYEIQLDKLKDDFERAFPSGNYRQGLPE
jgi:hypothetical protein